MKARFIKDVYTVVGCLMISGLLGCSVSRKVDKRHTGSLVRVMSYNVHHCNPPGKPGVIDIDAIADVINNAKPDLVGLQEIDVNTGRSGKGVNQAEALAAKTGMHFVFGKAIDYDGGEYGVAILSKFPLSDVQIIPLSSVKGITGEPRVLLTTKIKLASGTIIRFANTHLDAISDPAIRLQQIKDINAIALKEKLPFLITGDFNATPESSVIQNMDVVFKRTCMQCEPTIPADRPSKSIDYVAFKASDAFEIRDHKVIAAPLPSDHLPVVATLQLK
jgi:endonuclease/exonuclease/phosphatase family metal-dependent hydrolase